MRGSPGRLTVNTASGALVIKTKMLKIADFALTGKETPARALAFKKVDLRAGLLGGQSYHGEGACSLEYVFHKRPVNSIMRMTTTTTLNKPLGP